MIHQEDFTSLACCLFEYLSVHVDFPQDFCFNFTSQNILTGGLTILLRGSHYHGPGLIPGQDAILARKNGRVARGRASGIKTFAKSCTDGMIRCKNSRPCHCAGLTLGQKKNVCVHGV